MVRVLCLGIVKSFPMEGEGHRKAMHQQPLAVNKHPPMLIRIMSITLQVTVLGHIARLRPAALPRLDPTARLESPEALFWSMQLWTRVIWGRPRG